MLAKLTEREQEVLKRRYQLTADIEESATLKEIGDVYDITRERVRQIERDAIRKIVELAKTEEFSRELKSLEAAYVNYLERHGGVVREDRLLNDYVKQNHNFGAWRENAYLFALEHLFESTEKVEDHDYFYPVWVHQNIDLESIAGLMLKLENVLQVEKKLLQEQEIIELAKQHLDNALKERIEAYLAKHSDLNLENLLGSYLSATSKIENNIMNQWGLAEWETIRPKKLSDKIRLVFQKENAPLHFSDIAQKIADARFDHKNICPATVHNELIANPVFVLIGRGVYAMKDWGYSEGTVADIVARILKNAGRPLDREEIYSEVLKQRKVNKATIYLALINKDKFGKEEDGKFKLV